MSCLQPHEYVRYDDALLRLQWKNWSAALLAVIRRIRRSRQVSAGCTPMEKRSARWTAFLLAVQSPCLHPASAQLRVRVRVRSRSMRCFCLSVGVCLTRPSVHRALLLALRTRMVVTGRGESASGADMNGTPLTLAALALFSAVHSHHTRLQRSDGSPLSSPARRWARR